MKIVIFCLLSLGIGVGVNLGAQTSPTEPAPAQHEVSTIVSTGSGFDVLTATVSRNVADLQIAGSVGKRPLHWTRHYRSDIGKWADDWLYSADVQNRTYIYVTFPETPGTRVEFTSPQTHGIPGESAYRSGTTNTWRPERLFVSADIRTFRLVLADGSTVSFESLGAYSQTAGCYVGRARPTTLSDPHGLSVNYSYGSDGVSQLTDATGRWLKFFYSPAGAEAGSFSNTRVLSRVEGSDGQWVEYDWFEVKETVPYPTGGTNLYGGGRPYIKRARYADGLSATYSYGIQFTSRLVFEPEGYDPFGNWHPEQYITVWDWQGILREARDCRALHTIQSVRYSYPLNTSEFRGCIDAEIDPDSGRTITSISEAALGPQPASRIETRNGGSRRKFSFLFSGLNGVASGPLLEETDFIESSPGTWPNKKKLEYTEIRGLGRSLTAITDERGFITRFQVESVLGRTIRVTHPDNSYQSYTYSSVSDPYFIKSSTDELGRVTTYQRLGNGLISQIDYPDGSNEGWTYNSFNQPTVHRLRNGANEWFEYDSAGRLLKHWLPSFVGQVVSESYTYYPAGHPWMDRVKTFTDARGNATTYEYDHKFINGVESSELCPGRGLISKIINPDNTYQSMGHNAAGLKIWEENELRQRTSDEFDSYNRVIKHTDPLGQATVTTYQIDGSSTSLSSVTLPSGRRTEFRCDANLRRTEEIAAPGTPDESHIWYSYDAGGNIITQTQQADGGNRVTSYAYDSRNRKTTEYAPLGRTTDLGYDEVGNVIWQHYPDGTSVAKEYNSMNQVIRATDEMSRVTVYTYYPSGNLEWTIDAKNNGYRYEYDASNRMTLFWLTNPDQTGFDYEQTTYDSVGNIAGFRNRSGTLKTFTYDNRNREKSVTWNDGITPSISTDYDNAGRIVQRSNSTSTLSYRYDAAGRLIEERQALAGGPTSTITYEYDADGNRTKLSKR